MSLFPSNSTAIHTPALPYQKDHPHQAVELILHTQLIADQERPADSGAVSPDQAHDAVFDDTLSWRGTVISEDSVDMPYFRAYALIQRTHFNVTDPLPPGVRAPAADERSAGNATAGIVHHLHVDATLQVASDEHSARAAVGDVTQFDGLLDQTFVSVPSDWLSDSDSEDAVHLWPVTSIALDYSDVVSEDFSHVQAFASANYPANPTHTLHPDALGEAHPRVMATLRFSLDTTTDLLDSEGSVPAFLMGCTQEYNAAPHGGYHQ